MAHANSSWPGAKKRNPRRTAETYAIRAPLARWLRAEAAEASRGKPAGYRVLDVGCGEKPYYPFFAEGASEYVGVDVEGSHADLVGPVERLPVADGSFDLVLCLQVLEHAEDPAQAVGELRRVVAPGGRVLASTHGVQVYHPAPVDLWRWTHEGLGRLFRDSAAWTSVTVSPSAGSAACVGMLVSLYIFSLARRWHVQPLGRCAVASVNAAAELLDRRCPMLVEPRPGSLFANYHVTAIA
jgi:SAM-dependent methyltransferase